MTLLASEIHQRQAAHPALTGSRFEMMTTTKWTDGRSCDFRRVRRPWAAPDCGLPPSSEKMAVCEGEMGNCIPSRDWQVGLLRSAADRRASLEAVEAIVSRCIPSLAILPASAIRQIVEPSGEPNSERCSTPERTVGIALKRQVFEADNGFISRPHTGHGRQARRSGRRYVVGVWSAVFRCLAPSSQVRSACVIRDLIIEITVVNLASALHRRRHTGPAAGIRGRAVNPSLPCQRGRGACVSMCRAARQARPALLFSS